MIKHLFLIFCTFILLSCESAENSAYEVIERIYSPSGHEAAIVESNGNIGKSTQVWVMYDGGACGIGTVHANEIKMGLKVTWESDSVLVVNNPTSTQLERDPNGEFQQCGNQKLQVKITNSKKYLTKLEPEQQAF